MKLELVDHAWTVALKSASSILAAVASILGILAGLQPLLPALQGFIPAGWFAAGTVLCTLAIPLARVIKQPALRAATPQTTSPGEPGAATDGGTTA